MKPISVHVDENDYEQLKALAARQERPVAELVREAMSAYLAEQESAAGSILDLAPHDGGKLERPWKRAEIFEEMIRGRRS